MTNQNIVVIVFFSVGGVFSFSKLRLKSLSFFYLERLRTLNNSQSENFHLFFYLFQFAVRCDGMDMNRKAYKHVCDSFAFYQLKDLSSMER
jgi:hypothetical protein